MIPLGELMAHTRATAGTEDDVVAYERAAVAHVERATGRYFGPAKSFTDYLRGAGTADLWLSEAPLEPATVTLDGVAVALTDYSARGRVLRHVSAWGAPGYPAEYVVTYTAGYPVSAEADDYGGEPIVDIAAPEDIRQAVKLLVAHWYENRIPVALGTVAPEIAFTLAALLAPWKRVAV